LAEIFYGVSVERSAPGNSGVFIGLSPQIEWVLSAQPASEVFYKPGEDLLRDIGDFRFWDFAKGDSFEDTDGVVAVGDNGLGGLLGLVKLTICHLADVADNTGCKLGIA
jgi:hypothetical protein